MITLDFANMISFILQYLVATVASLYIFYILRKRRIYSKPEFFLLNNPGKNDHSSELIGMSFFTTVEKMVASLVSPILSFTGAISAGLPASDFRSEYRRGGWGGLDVLFVRQRKETFKAPSTRVKLPEIYYRKAVYEAFTAFSAVSVWAGILLLLTPYQKIFIFIPHFSSLAINLSVIIILAITIFEGSIATLFFFIGTTIRRVAVVMAAVLAVFSASLLTPSFTWFHGYTTQGELLIYTILVILILGITFLISLFREKRVLFRLALYSSFVSYGFFILVTTYNILATIIL